MHKKLYFLVTKYNIIHPLRFAFQAHHSIENTLISMTEVIENTLENTKYGCGVFVDLQNAFDSANHNILLSKLEHYGIRGNVQKLHFSICKTCFGYLIHHQLLTEYKTNH